LFKELEQKRKKIAVLGLGYVGIPLLVSLSRHFDVVGFDISKKKIESLYNNDDFNDIIDKNELKKLNCRLSSDEKILREANFFIVSVPTPIDNHNNPDLRMVKKATELAGRNMTEGSVVVYESTVYPGVTEEICIPILEQESGLVNLKDFWVG
jgi:UDP-N-acetyl-D-galactosamine dehydrogenase